jgi:hypothetical protein
MGKLTMPGFYFLLFPLLLIGFNRKVRTSLWKEAKESHSAENILTATESFRKRIFEG